MKVDASFLVRLNTLNSIVVLGLSFLQFKDTILPGPEIYFSMFLAVIALTFNNQINFGSRNLTWAAMFSILFIIIVQLINIDWGTKSLISKFWMNFLIVLTSFASCIIFIRYLLTKRKGY